MQHSASGRPLLPELRRIAIWHPVSGVIFSPYTRTLPSKVTWNPGSQVREDLQCPRMLHDHDLYLAFYPRKNWDSGALFSTLAPPNLSGLIVEAPRSTSDDPNFILLDDVCDAWVELENFLLDISEYLFSEYPEREHLPNINYPPWPYQCGYREAHPSKVAAFASLKNTVHAFRLLSAFVSFTLSLWITEFEDNCFDRPFDLLMKRPRDPVPPIYLDYLRDSVVCKMSPGLRPGGFLNPYCTKWGRVMYRFCRFRVPFWMVWGHEAMYKRITPVDRCIRDVFLPEDSYIEKVKERQMTFSWLVLPDNKGFGPAPAPQAPQKSTTACFEHPLPDYATAAEEANSSNALPGSQGDTPRQWEVPSGSTKEVDRTLIVDTYRTDQRPKESWENFRVRMEDGLQKRKAVESGKDKQRRESLEKNSRQNGYSSKTTVFIWEEDEQERGFYRRTKLNRVDVSKEWECCTEHQRFFWPHRNEWDIVPHLPRYPSGQREETPIEDLEISDDRFNFLYSMAPPRKPDDRFKSKPLSFHRIGIQNDGGNAPSPGPYSLRMVSLAEYLKFRYGFSISLIDNWHPDLHDARLSKKLTLSADKWKLALRRLGYGEHTNGQAPGSAEELLAVVNFCNICVAIISKNTHCFSLPSPWDLSSNSWLSEGVLRLRIQTARREGEGTKLYVIRPQSSSWDSSSWYIATTSATAVLLVFRKRFLTMREIARAFLDLGILFHTVEEVMDKDSHAPPYRYRFRGLDTRPSGFNPTDRDYFAYVEARDEIFRSPRARVLRLLGGIIGRLALEAVPDVAVLDGPSFCDNVIGRTDNTVFVDDSISENNLDIVAGVYGVSANTNAPPAHLSWWPKHRTWLKSGYHADQWNPNAELFYLQRVRAFGEKEWDLKPSTKWKESLKFDRAQMEVLYGGSEAVAAEFISRHFE